MELIEGISLLKK